MRRAIRALACAVCSFVAWCAPAIAAPTNGQLATVVDGRLVSLNPDGSGFRVLPVADAAQITELDFSPDGNRLAYVKAGEISVLDLRSGTSIAVTSGANDANPAWTPDGAAIVFRRGLFTYRVAAAERATPELYLIDLLAGTTGIAWAPRLNTVAAVILDLLVLPGNPLGLPPAVTDIPAWAPDNSAVAFARAGGLSSLSTSGGDPEPLVEGLAASPRWSPDSASLAYAAGPELRTVAAAGGTPRTLLTGTDRVGPVDWQPCVEGVTFRCVSFAPPRCTGTVATATTQSEQPVELLAPPCVDPAGHPLELVLAKAPDHGTVDRLRYTPAAGYSGQDTVAYRMTNGVAESETYRVTIFVVPRPVPVPTVVGTNPPVLVQGAPFLSARATPRLDGKRETLVKLSCDQNCSIIVRLSAKLRSNKSLAGPRVKRSLAATRMVSLHLRLPSRPKGTLKTVWVTGSVRNAVGAMRSVRLPVRLPPR